MKRAFELGELYKDLRIARGLKLKDVVHKNLSIAQLSRFENGLSMLSADKLLLAIEGIHMTFSEFGHALKNYEVSHFFKLTNRLSKLQSLSDIEGIQKILRTYESFEIFDVYNRLNKLIIDVAIFTLDHKHYISDDDKEFLTTYLYSIEEWTEYELVLFGNTMVILSDEDLLFLGKSFVKRYKLYLSILSNKKATEKSLLNLILILIERKRYYHANYFIYRLEEILTYQDMFARVTLTFFNLLVSYLQNEEKIDKTKLINYIKIVQELDNPILANFLKRNLEELTQNQ